MRNTITFETVKDRIHNEVIKYNEGYDPAVESEHMIQLVDDTDNCVVYRVLVRFHLQRMRIQKMLDRIKRVVPGNYKIYTESRGGYTEITIQNEMSSFTDSITIQDDFRSPAVDPISEIATMVNENHFYGIHTNNIVFINDIGDDHIEIAVDVEHFSLRKAKIVEFELSSIGEFLESIYGNRIILKNNFFADFKALLIMTRRRTRD